MTAIEQRPLAPPESPSTSGSSSSEDRKSKRCTPPELQVCEAIYFDSFPLCNCLHSFRFVLFIPPLMMKISSIAMTGSTHSAMIHAMIVYKNLINCRIDRTGRSSIT